MDRGFAALYAQLKHMHARPRERDLGTSDGSILHTPRNNLGSGKPAVCGGKGSSNWPFATSMMIPGSV